MMQVLYILRFRPAGLTEPAPSQELVVQFHRVSFDCLVYALTEVLNKHKKATFCFTE